jgi:hypothetical protein
MPTMVNILTPKQVWLSGRALGSKSIDPGSNPAGRIGITTVSSKPRVRIPQCQICFLASGMFLVHSGNSTSGIYTRSVKYIDMTWKQFVSAGNSDQPLEAAQQSVRAAHNWGPVGPGSIPESHSIEGCTPKGSRRAVSKDTQRRRA